MGDDVFAIAFAALEVAVVVAVLYAASTVFYRWIKKALG